MYNGHGDVEKIISGEGLELNTYYYDAYGNIEEKNESISNPYRYTGYYYDEESDNYYLQNRYYNPELGIFLTEDIYRGEQDDPLNLNRYIYVKQNPLFYTDPTGNVPIPLITGGVGALLNTSLTFINDLLDDGKINTGWKEYLGATAEGFIIGGSLGLAGPSAGAIKTLSLVAGGSALGDVTNQVISKGVENIDLKQTAVSTITTTVGTYKWNTYSKIKKVIDFANTHNGATQKSFKGAKVYKNVDNKLPLNVTYKEYDINLNIKGINRGKERIVIGDDGKIWFTKDHYKTFKEIKDI